MIQVLERAFSVLEFLSCNPGRLMGLSDIEQACGIQKTTLANILKTLEDAGYVARPQKRKGYRLGYKYYLQAGPSCFRDKWKELAAGEMQHLYDIFSETVVLACEYKGERMVVDLLECREGITARIPHLGDIYLSATGRVILANYPDSKIKSIVSSVGLPSDTSWSGIGSEKVLFERLAGIRKDGWCTSHDFGDVVGVAAPILIAGQAVASIGFSLPVFRSSESRLGIIREALQESATAIAAKILSADYSG